MPKLQEFGEKDGLPLVQAELVGTNSSVSILSLGAITQNWLHSGENILPIVLGYADPMEYLADPYYFGAIVGRVANRTAFGRFMLEGAEYQLPINDPPNHLHGGPQGTQCWNFKLTMDTAANAVILTHTSPDGHMGYPGRVGFVITITLAGDRLTYDMSAIPDRPTPINLAQHSYYNLTGALTCRNHSLWLNAEGHTPTDQPGIPKGNIIANKGTPLDFSVARVMGAADPKQRGLDTNVVLCPDRNIKEPAAILSADTRKLEVFTNQVGMQVYDSTHLKSASIGHQGRKYGRFAGLALEPQAFPNTLNNPAFGSIIVTPDQPYRQITHVKISNKEALI